jgi:hypothetical protein
VAAAAETGAGLVPEAPGDMVAFGHLSAFLCALLAECGPQRFAPWAYSFSSVVVAGSSRLPLLAPFYRLATTCMQLCTEGLLLEEPQQGSPAESSSSRSAPVDSLQQQAQQATQWFCLQTFQDYTKSVLASCRQFKEELLAAALQLLLAAPSAVLPAGQLVQPVQLALQLGLQNVAVAEMAVSALEDWERQQPQQMALAVSQVRAVCRAGLFAVPVANQLGTVFGIIYRPPMFNMIWVCSIVLEPAVRCLSESAVCHASDHAACV